MAKRRKKSNSLLEVGYRVSMLAGLGGLAGGLQLFDGIDPIQQLLLAVVTCMVAALGTMFVFLMINNALEQRRKNNQTFEFDQPVEDRRQTATKFEHDVAALIQQLTKKRTEVVGGAGDGGIDIKVFGEKRRLVGIVQCKHYSPDKVIPPAHIRDLNTVKHSNHVNIAYLVTTGRFSDKSHKLAKQLGVRLIDGDGLKALQKKLMKSEAIQAIG